MGAVPVAPKWMSVNAGDNNRFQMAVTLPPGLLCMLL